MAQFLPCLAIIWICRSCWNHLLSRIHYRFIHLHLNLCLNCNPMHLSNRAVYVLFPFRLWKREGAFRNAWRGVYQKGKYAPATLGVVCLHQPRHIVYPLTNKECPTYGLGASPLCEWLRACQIPLVVNVQSVRLWGMSVFAKIACLSFVLRGSCFKCRPALESRLVLAWSPTCKTSQEAAPVAQD